MERISRLVRHCALGAGRVPGRYVPGAEGEGALDPLLETFLTLPISSCSLSARRPLEKSFVTKSQAPRLRASIVISAWSRVRGAQHDDGNGLVAMMCFRVSMPFIRASRCPASHRGLELLRSSRGPQAVRAVPTTWMRGSFSRILETILVITLESSTTSTFIIRPRCAGMYLASGAIETDIARSVPGSRAMVSHISCGPASWAPGEYFL